MVLVVVAVAQRRLAPLVRHDLDGRAGAAVPGRPAPLLEPTHDHVWFEVAPGRHAGAREGGWMNYRKIATFTGWLWIITIVASIPARFFFYASVLDHKGNYVTGAGKDAHTLIAIGALL